MREAAGFVSVVQLEFAVFAFGAMGREQRIPLCIEHRFESLGFCIDVIAEARDFFRDIDLGEKIQCRELIGCADEPGIAVAICALPILIARE